MTVMDQMPAVGRLEARIRRHAGANQRQEAFYQGSRRVENLGVAVPPNMNVISPVMGWPSTVVDVIAERLDFLGFTGDDSGTLERAVRRSSLQLEFAKAVTDSLIYGVGFLEVSGEVGEDGSPVAGSPMVSAVDPTQASFEWDTDGRTVAAGLVWHRQADGQMRRTVHAPGLTVYEDEDGKEVVVKHGRPCAGLIPILNRTRSGHARGHSEITRAVRYATDHGMRAMLGMEYNREFYTTPQRYTVNAYADTMGMDDSGGPGAKERNREAAWNAAMTQHLVIPPTIEEETGAYVQPMVGQFASSPPTPYIEELRALTQIIAAEAAIPVHYLGFITENPSSADAIRQSEARLVKKAELKQLQISQVLVDMMAPLLWHISTGEDMPDEVRDELDTLWRDPATPTKAAMADAAVKIVGAGVAPARSAVIYDMLGMSPTDQKRLEADWARDTSRSLVGDLADRAAQARVGSTTVDDLAGRTEQADWSGDGS